MAHAARHDRPGALHHVINRGAGHNPIFASEEDVGRFLSLLALVTREGLLRILCYSVLSTHFHLVIQSPAGQLSIALQRIGQLYALWFNRTRERDGHTFKGRFFSRLIEDRIDLACTVTYADHNPVEAGMVKSPGAYAHGSARYYLGEQSPRWLSRDLLEELACGIAQIPRYRSDAYLSLWRFALASGGSDLVRRASTVRGARVAPLKVLINAGPEAVQRWLLENLRREEGRTRPCLVLAGDELIQRLDLGKSATESGTTQASLATAAGLLYAVSGWTMTEISIRFQVSQPTIHRAITIHRRRMLDDPTYREHITRAVATALSVAYGSLAEPTALRPDATFPRDSRSPGSWRT